MGDATYGHAGEDPGGRIKRLGFGLEIILEMIVDDVCGKGLALQGYGPAQFTLKEGVVRNFWFDEIQAHITKTFSSKQ